MKRLVVASNRLADLRKPVQSGGLVVGIGDALRQRGGIWFGWSGTLRDEGDLTVTRETVGSVEMIGVDLSIEDHDAYYRGYSNSVLWPLFHYRLDLVDLKREFFAGYRRVNRRFAECLAAELRDDDLVWIHDYHLIPLAAELRALGCRQRIGFFLHIPFPPPDLFAASPNHKFLVRSLLAYDVVGFQTNADAGNFRRYLTEIEGYEIASEGSVNVDGRTVSIGKFPIGIDVETFRGMAMAASDDVQIDSMRRQILGLKQIIGVDRLDYSKGLPERMQAVDRLLDKHPRFEGSLTYLQIASPTREDVDAYSDIRAELESLAGSVNGRYGDLNWTPVRYIHRNIPRDKLAALFRASQVGLVTPLRDGMNLVAKEYIAAQDEIDPGVLVLSQFAGAAEELEEALIVNPYDTDHIAETIAMALDMPVEERRQRHAALLARIRAADADAWISSYLDSLEGITRSASQEGARLEDQSAA